MVKRLVCNRFIRVEILGKKDGRALVSMIDESSDPQTNAAEVLVNMGYASIESVETEKHEPTQASFPEMPCKWKIVVITVCFVDVGFSISDFFLKNN